VSLNQSGIDKILPIGEITENEKAQLDKIVKQLIMIENYVKNYMEVGTESIKHDVLMYNTTTTASI
jgi:hypothetical protein